MKLYKFLHMISDSNGLNIGQRNISLSTCGIVPKIDELSEENEAKTKERAMLEKTLADAEERHGQLRKWFESLDMTKYDARIKQAQQRINMFEDAQKALFYEMDELNLAQTVSNQEANEKREELRLQLKQIEQLLEDYRKKYKMICELLSD